jgi:alpha-mannosidase
MDVELAFRRRADEPFVRVAVVVESRRPDHRLRLHVELLHPTHGSVAGAPFELVDRPLLSEGSDLELPSPTWPARGYVAAGGIALLHPGVFEYEVVEGRELAVTLQRAVGTISRQSIRTRPWPAGPDIATPEGQMIGRMEVELAIVPDADRDRLWRDWELFALPVISAATTGEGSGVPGTACLLCTEGVPLSSVRRIGEDVHVTLWNPGAREIEVDLERHTFGLRPHGIGRYVRRPDGSVHPVSEG